MKEKRERWLDAAKGVAVLLVIIGHIRGQYVEDWITVVISSLHNPTFYMASGFLLVFKPQNENSYLKIITDYVIKLLVPFFIWVFLFSILCMLSGNYSFKTAVLDSANKLWFLPILFIGSVFASYIIGLRIPKWYIYIVCSLLIIIFSFWSSMITKIVCYALMILIGANLELQLGMRKRIIAICATMIYFILLIANISGILKPEHGVSALGIYLCCNLLMGICGGILLILMMQAIEKKLKINVPLLEFIGKNSLYFYILHFIGIYFLENTNRNMINGVIGAALCLICPLIGIFGIKKTKLNMILFMPKRKGL